MSALTVDDVVTPAERVFARAGHGPLAPTAHTASYAARGPVADDARDHELPVAPGGRAPGTTRSAGPRARLVRAAEPARVERAGGPRHVRPPTVAQRLDVLRAQDRSPVLDAADEDRGAVPQADPTVLAGRIALATVEVLGGRRPLAQLARWLTPGVYDALQVRTDLTLRVRRGRPTTRAPQVRRVRTCAVDPHTLEASAVVDDGAVVRAVAVRLESHRGAWRATVLEVG